MWHKLEQMLHMKLSESLHKNRHGNFSKSSDSDFTRKFDVLWKACEVLTRKWPEMIPTTWCNWVSPISALDHVFNSNTCNPNILTSELSAPCSRGDSPKIQVPSTLQWSSLSPHESLYIVTLRYHCSVQDAVGWMITHFHSRFRLLCCLPDHHIALYKRVPIQNWSSKFLYFPSAQ